MPFRVATGSNNLARIGTAPRFATSVHSSGRYLLDQYGQPFLLVGDSGWCAFSNISAANQETYFASRQAAGFNTIMCASIADTYLSNINGDALTTFDGVAPFTSGTTYSNYDIATPNSTYWARVDTFVALAASHGLTIMFVPNEAGSPALGAAGAMIISQGATKARAFGQFLGARYRNSPNVMWLHGNDYGGDGSVAGLQGRWDAGDPALTAVNKGIRDVAVGHLQTVELDFLTSTSYDDAAWPPLIDLNAIYVYDSTYTLALSGYNASPTKPTFFVEGSYENSTLSAGSAGTYFSATAPNQRLILRRQLWYPVLCGATGGLFGNQTVYPFTGSWAAALTSTSTTEVGYLPSLFATIPWWTLVPDQTSAFLTSGAGTHNTDPLATTLCKAAVDPAGATGLVYSPDGSTSPIMDMTKMRGTTLCRWYDPTGGSFTAIGSFANTGTHTFSPPAAHADGTRDWVLVMTA